MRNNPPTVHPNADKAKARLRAAIRDLPDSQKGVTVLKDDIIVVLDENREQRARIRALWREMSEPLPGMEEAP